MAESLGQAVLELRTDDRGLRRGLRTAEGGAQRLNSVFKTVAASVAAAFSVRVIVDFGRELVNVASAAEETANKFNVVFGASAAGARAELEALTSTIPLTVAEMEAMASGIQDLLVPMGVARDQASGMSVDMLQLAGDIASFNNVDATQVLEAMKSALAGSSEPIRRFGVDTRVTRLETLAFEEGLASAGEELNETARAQAVMLAIQRDSTDAMGDAARTVDSTANSMRFFSRETRQLREDLGEFLLPTVGELAGALAEVTGNLREFADSEEGVQLAQDLGDAVGELADSFVDLFNILNDLRPLLGLVFTAFEGELDKLRGLANVVAFLSAQFENVARTLGLVQEEVRGVSSIRGGLSGLFPSDAELRIAELTNEELVAMGENAGAASRATADLEGRLEELAVAGDAAEQRMEALNEQHRANLRAIRDNLEIQENFAEAIKMSTEEMASQASTAKVLQDALDDLDIPDVTEIFGVPDAPESRRVARALGELFEEVADDVGRALADAIISGDVESAIDAFGRALEAAAADALSRAVGDALSAAFSGQDIDVAAFAGGVAAGFAGIIINKAIEILDDAETGRRLTGDVTIGAGGVTTPPDFESASRETRAAFTALDNAITQGMAQLQETLRFEIPVGFEATVLEIQAQVVDGVTRFKTGVLSGTEQTIADFERAGAAFETAEAAAGFALQQFTQALIDQGAEFDSAVAELIQGFGAGLDPDDAGFENFQAALTRVQQLADQAAMSLDGVTEVELALQSIGPQAQALARELTALGLSAAETSRLVGGQIVQSFQALRQQITGEQLSVEQRREIAEANAELFNAELELQIARLEAERDALIAEAGIAQQEAALNSNVIDARSRFVSAQSDVHRAELGVMEGFIRSAGSVVRAGVELIGDTAVVLGDALGALPEEIRKQVEAIQKVIDALRRIGTISPGDIRISGVGSIPSPRPGRPVGGGGPGPGPEIDDAARAAREEIDRLIRSLDDLAAESIRAIDQLEGAVDGLRLLRDEIRLTTQAPGQQIETVRQQLLAATRQFESGDVSAAADVQRLGRLFAQLVGQQFSPVSAGFLANQRFLADILDRTIDSGEEQLATERELLDSLNERQADLLEQLVELGELTEDEIDEIRQRGEEQTAATRGVEDRVSDMSRTIDKLARAVERLAREAARNNQAA